jgi:hypothetical protein
MRMVFRSLNVRLLSYSIFYFLVMSHGLDLVQSQASQVLPYIAWFKNPELFQSDLLGMTFPYYGNYSLWYKAAGWLSYVFPPMGVIDIYFFLQCVLEVFGMKFLSKRLFPGLPEQYTWITIVHFTFGGVLRHSLGSVAPFGWTVFPETLVTSILFFAIGYVLEKRYFPALLVIALGFYIHLSVTLFVFIVAVVLYLMNNKLTNMRQVLKMGAVFTVLVFPLGISIINNPSPPLTADFDIWLSTIKKYQGMHSFPSQFGLFQYIPFLFWVLLFLTSLNVLKAPENKKEVVRFCSISAVVLVVSTFFIELFPVKTVIVLSFFRGSRFIVVFAVFYSVALLYRYRTETPALPRFLRLKRYWAQTGDRDRNRRYGGFYFS